VMCKCDLFLFFEFRVACQYYVILLYNDILHIIIRCEEVFDWCSADVQLIFDKIYELMLNMLSI
jgi:hypothetical protein